VILELLPKFLQQPSFASYSRETFETRPFEQLLSIQSTATTTKKKKEEEGAWRSKALRDGGGKRGTSFELRTQCFISPPLPRGFVFCTHISSHLLTCTCTSAKSKGSNFLYTLCNSKSCTSCHIPLQKQQFSCNSFAPTFQYLCNSKAATLLYMCSSSSKAPNFPLPLQQQHSSNFPTKPTKKLFSNSQIMLKI